MGMIVLDTAILIDNLRGRPDTGEVLDKAAARGDEFFASVLTRVEILAGMCSHERAATHALLHSLAWINVDSEISWQAGEFARKFRSSHHNIGVVDYVIAATATQLDASLWTRNVKHFPMFPDLAPPY